MEKLHFWVLVFLLFRVRLLAPSLRLRLLCLVPLLVVVPRSHSAYRLPIFQMAMSQR